MQIYVFISYGKIYFANSLVKKTGLGCLYQFVALALFGRCSVVVQSNTEQRLNNDRTTAEQRSVESGIAEGFQ